MQTPSQGETEFSESINKLVGYLPEDSNLPRGLESISLTLNRRRLADFLDRFASDSDLQDFLLLDLLAVAIDARISSTGELELVPDLGLRPFRLWEYVWLYKTLRLAAGGKTILDLGGPASHIVISAALAGNHLHSVDLNPAIVEAGRHCAGAFRLENYRAEVGDMRDLSSIAPGSVDGIICCSVLEHLTSRDQETAVSEMARLLAPGGIIGLTFDYGPGAAGANPYLPPPHDPPDSAAEVRRRYVHSGLEILGDFTLEDPVPGSLFHTDQVSYTIGALFLGKAPLQTPPIPTVIHRTSSLMSDVKLPDLLTRLCKKAHRDLAFVEQAKAYQQAAEERLQALELANAELHRLYDELEVRKKGLLEMDARLKGAAP